MSEATGTSDLPCFPWLADPGGLRRRVPPHRVTNGARIKVNHCIRGLVRRTMRVPTDGLGTVKRGFSGAAQGRTTRSLWRYSAQGRE
jgi:hypothetical protein